MQEEQAGPDCQKGLVLNPKLQPRLRITAEPAGLGRTELIQQEGPRT